MIKPIENWLTLDEHGVQMPWYTRPLLQEMDKWDFNDLFVFEYGLGYSTLWYKSRGAKVYGVDMSNDWYGKVYDGQGTFALAFDQDQYIEFIHEWKFGFDIVIIDGNFRDNCTEHALKALRSGGKLILDNWLQPEVEPFWPKTEALIAGMPIEIFREPDHPHWQTAVVTKV